MNLHQTIPGTVLNLPLQSDLLDTSGNGLHAEALDVSTHGVGTQVYVPFDPCINGISLGGPNPVSGGANVETKLRVASSPLLRMTGDCTFEWLMSQRYSFTNTYFTCVDPAGRAGGFGAGDPAIVGSLYTLFWGGDVAMSDQFYGGGGGVGTGRTFTGANFWPDITLPWAFHPHHYAARRLNGVWSVFRDGVRNTPDVTEIGTNVVVGNERFFIGGTELVNNGGGGWFASFRVLNYGATDAQIAADANYTTGACGGAGIGGPGGSTVGLTAGATAYLPSVALAADTGRIYRYAPGHMPQLKGNR